MDTSSDEDPDIVYEDSDGEVHIERADGGADQAEQGNVDAAEAMDLQELLEDNDGAAEIHLPVVVFSDSSSNEDDLVPVYGNGGPTADTSGASKESDMSTSVDDSLVTFPEPYGSSTPRAGAAAAAEGPVARDSDAADILVGMSQRTPYLMAAAEGPVARDSDAADILVGMSQRTPYLIIEFDKKGKLLPGHWETGLQFVKKMIGDDGKPVVNAERFIRLKSPTGKLYDACVKAVDKNELSVKITGNNNYFEQNTRFDAITSYAISLEYDLKDKVLDVSWFFLARGVDMNKEKALFRDSGIWRGFGPRGMSLVQCLASILPGCEEVKVLDVFRKEMRTVPEAEHGSFIESKEYGRIIGDLGKVEMGYRDDSGNVVKPLDIADRADMARQYADIISLGGDAEVVSENGYYGRYGFKQNPDHGGYTVKPVDMVGLASRMRTTGRMKPKYSIE